MVGVEKKITESRLGANAEMEVIEDEECSETTGTSYKF